MNKFLEILSFILVGIIVLVAADQISGALERARQRRLDEKAAADKAKDTANGTA